MLRFSGVHAFSVALQLRARFGSGDRVDAFDARTLRARFPRETHILDPTCTTGCGLAFDCRLMSTAAIKIINSTTAAPMPRTPATNTRAGVFPNANATKNAITATPASICTIAPAVCVHAEPYSKPENRVKPLNVGQAKNDILGLDV